jgi:hypothetical protein
MDNNDGWKEVGGGPQYDMWDEDANKSIVGKYVDVRHNVGKNNSNIYVLELENGEKRGIWGSTVLDGRFENIELNSVIRIDYLGKTPGKDARGAYKNYRVFVRDANAPAAPAAPATGTDQPKSDDLPF